jgi:ketosteroid isomerase-like protein
MFKSIDGGTPGVIGAWADADAVVFDFDEKNNPVKVRGAAEIQAFFEGFAKAMTDGGLKFATSVVSMDCSATTLLGHCTSEFDQTITMGGNAMGPFKFRGTLVARKLADGWKWTHWHGSFRELPTAPPGDGAAPSGTAPASGEGAAPAAQ